MDDRTELIDGLTIRCARDDEMDAVCAIAKVAWEPIHEVMAGQLGHDVHAALTGDWKTEKADQIRRQYASHPDRVLTVLDGEVVAAFVTFAVKRDVSLGEIHNNAVSPDYQGRGIATAMYRHVLKLFRDMGLAYASVHTGLDPGHAPARAAYEKAGFDLHREDVTYYKKL